MGNTSSSTAFTPRSLIQCMNREGKIDMQLYYLYNRRKRRIRNNDELDAIIKQCALEEKDTIKIKSTRKRTPRSCLKRNLNFCRSSDGTLIPVGPTTSTWFNTYVQNPTLEDSKFHYLFRRRFRCSYDSFLKLYDLVKQDDLFLRWQVTDAAFREPSSLQLMLLGALRYLGRGWTFDDLYENTSISEETHRQFFHVFILWGSTTLYDLYVIYPTDKEHVPNHVNEMKVAGFHGCVGSTDATHVFNIHMI